MEIDIIKEFRDRLLKREDFMQVVEFFVKKSTEELKKEESSKESLMYSEFYNRSIKLLSHYNYENVFKFSRSPIETISVNSLILLFIKNGLLELNITEVFTDFELSSSNYKKSHKNIMKLSKDYVSMSGDNDFNNFEDFFQKKIDTGYYTKEDYYTFEYHRLIVENFMWDTYYLTLQAGLPNIIVEKKGIKVDMLFWKPSDEAFKLVIECDGFIWHNTKKSFENDRKRDRLLKMNGYDVIRFAGAEIYKDPFKIASEIYDYINSYKSQKSNNFPY